MNKRLLLTPSIIFFLIIFSTGCSINSEKNSTEDYERAFNNNINQILKEEFSNQLNSLYLINIYISAVINLKDTPLEQMYYLGKVSTAKNQLNTIVYLTGINIGSDGETAKYIPLANTMYGISEIGNSLTAFTDKGYFKNEDYNILNEVLNKSEQITRELEELLNKQNLIDAQYNLEKVEILINEIKKLLL